MKEWTAYTLEDGECLGGIAYEDELSLEEAQERADAMFGEDVTYVALVNRF